MRLKKLFFYSIVATGLLQLSDLSAFNLQTNDGRRALKQQVVNDIDAKRWIAAAGGIQEFERAKLPRFAIDLRKRFAEKYRVPGALPAGWPSLQKVDGRRQATGLIRKALGVGNFSGALAGIQKMPEKTRRDLYKEFVEKAIDQEKAAQLERERLEAVAKDERAMRAQEALRRAQAEENRQKAEAEERLAQEQERARQQDQQRAKEAKLKAEQEKRDEEEWTQLAKEHEQEEERQAKEKAKRAEAEREDLAQAALKAARDASEKRAQAEEERIDRAEAEREDLAQAALKAAQEASEKRAQAEEKRIKEEAEAARQKEARDKLFAQIRNFPKEKKEAQSKKRKVARIKSYFTDLLMLNVDPDNELYTEIYKNRREKVDKLNIDVLTALYKIFSNADDVAAKGEISDGVVQDADKFYLKKASGDKIDEITDQVKILELDSDSSHALLKTIEALLKEFKPAEQVSFVGGLLQRVGLQEVPEELRLVFAKLNVVRDLLRLLQGESLVEVKPKLESDDEWSDSESDDAGGEKGDEEQEAEAQEEIESEPESEEEAVEQGDEEPEEVSESEEEEEIPEPEEFGGGFTN